VSWTLLLLYSQAGGSISSARRAAIESEVAEGLQTARATAEAEAEVLRRKVGGCICAGRGSKLWQPDTHAALGLEEWPVEECRQTMI
jgi:hypothetical protein